MTLNLIWFLLLVQAGGVAPPPGGGGNIDKITLGFKPGGVTGNPHLGGPW